MVTAIAVIAWCLFASWAIRIGVRKGRILAGVVLGVAFAWLGVIIMVLLPPAREH